MATDLELVRYVTSLPRWLYPEPRPVRLVRLGIRRGTRIAAMYIHICHPGMDGLSTTFD